MNKLIKQIKWLMNKMIKYNKSIITILKFYLKQQQLIQPIRIKCDLLAIE